MPTKTYLAQQQKSNRIIAVNVIKVWKIFFCFFFFVT